MQKTYDVYSNLGYWLILLVVLILIAFYPRYFALIAQPMPALVHVHFVLLSLWTGMVIAQPFLIKYKKRPVHRLLGKVSYVLAPLVLLSAFLMIRLSYYRVMDQLQRLGQLTEAEILQKDAAEQAIAVIDLAWFAVFYLLAVINRKNSFVHSRYMVATALTLLGPVVERILALYFGLRHIGPVPLEAGTFILTDAILILLLLKDYRDKQPAKTMLICTSIYLIGQVLFLTSLNTIVWGKLMALMMGA